MPVFFFNINHTHRDLDEYSLELPDNEAAWREATMTAGELLKEVDGKFRPGQDWVLEVTDDNQKPVYVIRIIGREMK
jgi:hypothetical protein